jgi:tetratricopeptide (TPR) repeat protein
MVERGAILNALYHQGLDALQRGDHAAAVAALAPVAREAPQAYPDVQFSLDAALQGLGQPAAPATGWRALPRPATPAPLRRWARRVTEDAAARGPRWARPLAAALQRGTSRTAPDAPASSLLPIRVLLGAVTSRQAFPVWGIATLVAALILGAFFVSRGGSGESRAPAARAAAPLATPVAESELAARCDEALATERWADAIRACRVLRARAPDREGLADKLATAYVKRGEQRLGSGDDLQAAAGDFEQALAFQPESAEAQRAFELLHLYREGDKALGAKDWETAIVQFSAAHAQTPDYLQGLGERSLTAKLFAAWLGWGQAALDAGDQPAAAARCTQALALVADDPEAKRCVADSSPAEAVPPPADAE